MRINNNNNERENDDDSIILVCVCYESARMCIANELTIELNRKQYETYVYECGSCHGRGWIVDELVSY